MTGRANSFKKIELAQRLAYFVDRLRDVSAFGLRFSKNTYDRAHYQTVQDIALELFALAAQEPAERFEPLCAPVLSRPTPFVAGDAAIVDGDGRLLLVLRADNGLRAMPCGAVEVGETPAAGVEHEAYEETGVHCQAVRLIGVLTRGSADWLPGTVCIASSYCAGRWHWRIWGKAAIATKSCRSIGSPTMRCRRIWIRGMPPECQMYFGSGAAMREPSLTNSLPKPFCNPRRPKSGRMRIAGA